MKFKPKIGVAFTSVEGYDLDQEKLDQAMAAQHVNRQFPAGSGQSNAAVGLVTDQAALLERLDHCGHRTRRNTQRRGHAACAAGRA